MLGEGNTVGALEGRTAAGPMSFGRISTDDTSGKIRAYFGDGYFTNDALDTFGTRAVVQIRSCSNRCSTSASMDSSITPQ